MSKRYEFGDEGLAMLVYGDPGAGKTRFVATAAADPGLAPALMLEAFGNPISIRDYEQKPDIITLEKMEDFNEPYEWIMQGQPTDHPYCVDFELNPPYRTIIVDGLTEVQRFVIRKVTGVDFTGPGSLTPALGRQGFGQLLGTMLNWATHYVGLSKLGLNVLITSLETTNTDKVRPLLWGQSGGEICGYVLMVMRIMSVLSTPKSLLMHPDDPVTSHTTNVGFFEDTVTYYAKDQYNIGVGHMTNPTLPKLMGLLERSKT